MTEALVGCLASLPHVTLYGPRTADPGRRVPVVSFTAAGMKSADISARLQARRRCAFVPSPRPALDTCLDWKMCKRWMAQAFRHSAHV